MQASTIVARNDLTSNSELQQEGTAQCSKRALLNAAHNSWDECILSVHAGECQELP